MLDVNISDSRLASMLRHYISANAKYGADKKLKGIKLCGSRILPAPCGDGHVYIIKSVDTARYMGLAHCHSPWACPICSAKVMAEKGGEIASLIDARLTWEKKSAFMITFTLPHTKGMSCQESFQVLNDTWRLFTRDGRKAKNSQGKSMPVYGKMRNKFDIQSIVRVYEFTWGENGWHPHIHALFWTKRENFKALLPYEDLLTDRWLDCAKRCHAKLKTNIDLDKLYAEYKRRPVTGHRAVYFSKTSDGNIREEASAHYISGWGADSELTRGGKQKQARHGHYSPYQLLLNAQFAKDEAEKNFWLDLYVEYAKTTRGHKRVNFTPGDQQLIAKWRQTNSYISTLKKNLTDKVTKQQAVFWFSKQQWHEILVNEHESPYLRVHILEAAIRGPSFIISLLQQYGIDVSSNDLNSPGMKHVNENVIHAIMKQKTNAA